MLVDMRTPLITLFPALLLALPVTASAQAEPPIYRGQDAAGNPRYSDQPSAGEPFQLEPLNRVQPTSSTPAFERSPAENARRSVTITAPANGTVVGHAMLGVTVRVEIEGALQAGEQYRCLHNGRVVASLRSDRSCWVPLPERGEQQLQVVLYSAAGTTLLHSEAVVVYVQRHHLPVSR